MSKNFKGYLGDQIGKLGTAVGRRWKRKMVYASYQGKVRNPRTAAQLLARAKFKLMTSLCSAFDAALALGLRQMANSRQCTERNCFTSLNYGVLEGSTPEGVTVDPSLLKISQGSLTGVIFNPTVDVTTPGKVTVTIDNGNSGAPKTSADDRVYVQLFNPEQMNGVLSEAVARTARTVEVPVPSQWEGQEAHAYGFVVNAAGKASETIYIGHATIG